MRPDKFYRRLAEIRSSLVCESGDDDLLQAIINAESLEDLKKQRDVITAFKKLPKEEADELLDKLFDMSIKGEDRDERLELLYNYLREVNESGRP